MKLITELNEEIQTLIQEDAQGKKNLYMEGIFAQAEVKNKNGRIYPFSVMKESLDKYINEKVNTKSAWGELGHPQGPKINETLVSHLIEKADWNGNDVIGRAKVTLGTPNGKTLAGLIESGGRVGVSTRALGEVKQNARGLMEVQSGLKFATLADAVLDPSAPAAFVKGILENVDFFWDAAHQTFCEQKLEDMQKQIHKISTNQIAERKYALFEEYLNMLVNK